jgi:hypothetical protein
MDELMRPPAEETKRRWRKLEADLAERLEGWLTVASGAKSDKGDAKSYLFLGECKYRWAYEVSMSWFIPLDLQWLETIWRHAQAKRKIPLLALEWGDGSRAFMIPQYYYLECVGGSLFGQPQPHTNRIINFGVVLTEDPHCFTFENIEIPEKNWVLLPWSELSWLRTAELDERKEIGKKEQSKLRKRTTVWSKRPFPTKIVR